jgi:hypothetical protein
VTENATRTCLRCGYASTTSGAFCRRCGLPYGAAPAVAADDTPAECPVCYARADRSGTYPAPGGGRTTYERHAYDHEIRPVGDDDWLETLRDGDEIVIGHWRAPFALTRRYLVTGQWDGGRDRTYVHNAVILAMVGASREAGTGAATTTPSAGGASTSRFGFLRRPSARPGSSADSGAAPADSGAAPADGVAEARRAVDGVRERYLAGSRR